MSQEHEPLVLDERTRKAVDELKATIIQHYPAATFTLSRGEDNPQNIHLNTVVDVDDAFEVLDWVVDRVVDLQVEEGIPIHVIPVRPPKRVLEELQLPRPRRRLRIDLEEFVPPAQP